MRLARFVKTTSETRPVVSNKIINGSLKRRCSADTPALPDTALSFKLR
jgi:hypothetical protein